MGSIMATMRPLRDFPEKDARAITTVFTDIDDTLTSQGRLPSCAYRALEDLFNAGLDVVPVTGRPAGWCDMIARFWPVNGVVGENGAFYFTHDVKSGKMNRKYFAPQLERQAGQLKLKKIVERVLKQVPGCAVSADQAYRDVDLAIDFCEDVAPLGMAGAKKIKQIAEQEGATAKISSIHVNCWFGDFDKLTMTHHFAGDVLGFDLDKHKSHVVFCGDSPNDAPMFGYFPNSCGVANVREFEKNLTHKPKWITGKKGGEGFAELAQRLLSARRP